ncbi:unnamed protein product [Penicillium camemberti]|uniref:Str. FM013 n=1 Tax=Penicillium camemberti (strain FM 013) TaxID=1429867 RepID=A0A0G4NY60_PENC3|nr:unnamed protein product [Penicillium camemberti]
MTPKPHNYQQKCRVRSSPYGVWSIKYLLRGV